MLDVSPTGRQLTVEQRAGELERDRLVELELDELERPQPQPGGDREDRGEEDELP